MNVLSGCDNREALVAYLYGEAEVEERRGVEAHLRVCPDCRNELEAWQATRGDLAAWTPPEQRTAFRLGLVPVERPAASLYRAWAVAAAAVLVLGVSAAVANLQIQYGPQGLSVRTGWQAPAVPASAPAVLPASPSVRPAPEDWRMELAAVEGRLRREMAERSTSASLGSAAPSSSRPQAEVLRRVQQLIDESESRQQRQLALRMSELLRDVEVQRRSDLVRIQQGLSQVEGITGAEAARQREVLNYLVRVSQQR
jgi:anti-sigma factor RsiW